MAGSSVDFKANANGLVVVFDKNETFDSIFEQLSRKLESGGMFFQTRYLATSYRGRKLSAEEEGQISRMMSEKTGARTVIFEYDKDFERASVTSASSYSAGTVSATGSSAQSTETQRRYESAQQSAPGEGYETRGRKSSDDTAASKENIIAQPSEARTKDIVSTLRKRYNAQDLDECVTRFHRGTLRSGKLVSYNGNVVIIGDINPGAEVEATGNILVIGNVRGIVHAGAGGNKEASVIALNFAPTQLRIADIITNKVERKPPKGRALGTQPAEIAYILGDEIVFEKVSSNAL